MKTIVNTFLLSASLLGLLEGAVVFQTYERMGHPLERSFPVAIDFDGNGITDIELRGSAASTSIDLWAMVPPTTGIVWLTTQGGLFNGHNLDQGFEIDGLETKPLYAYMQGSERYGIAHLNGFANEGSGSFFETSGYLGVRFEGDEGTNYGYVHLNGERVLNFNVISYAYESEPNTPILTGAIPEPSTTFALFLSSLMLWRRRP